MSSVQAKDLKKGRIAVTTNKLANGNVPIGAWSVLVSDGVKQPPSAVNNGNGQGGGAAAGRAARSKNVCDIIFFASKADAYEESAYLNGKRPDSAQDTAARRRRSIGGQAVELAVHEMGRMGVGLVLGENNVNGVRLLASGAIDTGGGLGLTEEQKALAAVASLKATLVGSEVKEFTYSNKNNDLTVVPAKVKAVNGKEVIVEVSDPDDADAGDVKMSLANARKLFPSVADPIGGSMGEGAWTGLAAVMKGMAGLYSPANGGFLLRGVLLVMAALGTVKAPEIASLATAGRDDFIAVFEGALAATEKYLDGVDVPAALKKADELAAVDSKHSNETYIARAITLAKSARRITFQSTPPLTSTSSTRSARQAMELERAFSQAQVPREEDGGEVPIFDARGFSLMRPEPLEPSVKHLLPGGVRRPLV